MDLMWKAEDYVAIYYLGTLDSNWSPSNLSILIAGGLFAAAAVEMQVQRFTLKGVAGPPNLLHLLFVQIRYT